MRIRMEREPGQGRATTATERGRPVRATPAALLQLSRTAGNHAVCRALSRRVLARKPETDKTPVAAALYPKGDERAEEKAYEILKNAEAMKFYAPVRDLALTGKVLNPEGLATTVSEFYAKSRVAKPSKQDEQEEVTEEDAATTTVEETSPKAEAEATSTNEPMKLPALEPGPRTEGLVAELLQALAAANAGNFVQLGGWRPDPMQKRMRELVTSHPNLKEYLDETGSKPLKLGQGFGGDLVLWKPDGKGGLAVTTEQHKVIVADKADTLETELKRAAIQLAGANLEVPPPGRRVARLLVVNRDNPLHQESFDKQILDRVEGTLKNNRHGQRTLAEWVHEVIVVTDAGSASYAVEGADVKPPKVSESKEVAKLREAKPKEEGDERAPVKQPVRDSAETIAYNAAKKERQSAGKALPTPKDVIDANKWLSANRNLATVDQKELREKEAIVEKHNVNKEKHRKDLDEKWALEKPELAKVITHFEDDILAATELTKRRKDVRKADFEKLAALRSARVSAVKYRLPAKRSTGQGTDELFVSQLLQEFAEHRPDDNAEIERLQKELIADVWFQTDDNQRMKDAMKRVVADENKPDYTGSGPSKSSAENKEKIAREDTARKDHDHLARVIEPVVDQETFAEVFRKIAAVKLAEGNAAAVGDFVNRLTGALERAWKLADTGAIDVALLKAATVALANINAGVGYVGVLGEVNELNRRAQESGDRAGTVQISQWYALDQGSHATWELADSQARTTKDTSVAQEVDVSYVDTKGVLHISEVAADIDTLHMKLRSKEKLKQRTSYETMQRKRGAKVSYVIDSAEGWMKIFTMGGTAQKGTVGMNAPMVKWLVDRDMLLVVAGTTYDRGGLEKTYETSRAK